MLGRIFGAVCVAAVLAGCAKSPDEVPGVSTNAAASRGYDAYNRGDYSGAAAFFETALSIDPNNSYAVRGLEASRDSFAYFGDNRSGPRDIARENTIYRTSLQGYNAYTAGDMVGAETQFRAVLAIDPGNAYALRGLDTVRRNVSQPAIYQTPAIYADPVYDTPTYDIGVADVSTLGSVSVDQPYYDSGAASVDLSYGTIQDVPAGSAESGLIFLEN